MRSVLSAGPVTLSHAIRRQTSLGCAQSLSLLPSSRALSTVSNDEAYIKKKLKAIDELYCAGLDNRKYVNPSLTSDSLYPSFYHHHFVFDVSLMLFTSQTQASVH